MSWVWLFLAGLMETVWAVGLKYTDGFRRPVPSAITVAAMVASVVLLATAVRELPIGTAYAVWTGIGATGAALLGVLLFGEALTPPRALFLSLRVVSIVGLRLTS